MRRAYNVLFIAVASVLLIVIAWIVLIRPDPDALTETDRVAPAPLDVVPDQPDTVPAPETDLEAIECQMDVERWDGGNRAEVERKYGENTEAVVEGCRAIVAPPAP